jgi:hypothetical protein
MVRLDGVPEEQDLWEDRTMLGELPNAAGKTPGISLRDKVSVSPDVVFRQMEGEMVLLDLATATYFGLDGVGARLWELLREDGSLERAFTVMRGEYDVAPPLLERDLLRLLEELRQRGLVSVSTAPRT